MCVASCRAVSKLFALRMHSSMWGVCLTLSSAMLAWVVAHGRRCEDNMLAVWLAMLKATRLDFKLHGCAVDVTRVVLAATVCSHSGLVVPLERFVGAQAPTFERWRFRLLASSHQFKPAWWQQPWCDSNRPGQLCGGWSCPAAVNRNVPELQFTAVRAGCHAAAGTCCSARREGAGRTVHP